VDVELGALVLADVAPGIDGILLLGEMAVATGRAVFSDIRVLPRFHGQFKQVSSLHVLTGKALTHAWAEEPIDHQHIVAAEAHGTHATDQ
jgi:hypothetical protein